MPCWKKGGSWPVGLLPAPRSSDHSCAASTSTATTLPSGRMSMASEFWETLVWTSTCSHELYTEAGGAVHENALVLLGIGIDESTAFEIAGGVCGVQGRPRVAFYNPGAWTASAQARSRECSPWILGYSYSTSVPTQCVALGASREPSPATRHRAIQYCIIQNVATVRTRTRTV